MTTFTKVWALKSDTPAAPGDTVLVTLKSGQTKQVTILASFPSNGHFILIPEGVKAS
jgi:hypothetical protein